MLFRVPELPLVGASLPCLGLCVYTAVSQPRVMGNTEHRFFPIARAQFPSQLFKSPFPLFLITLGNRSIFLLRKLNKDSILLIIKRIPFMPDHATVFLVCVTKDRLVHKSGRNVHFLRNEDLVMSIAERSSTPSADRRTTGSG